MKPIIGDQIEHAEIYETVEPRVAPNSSLRLQDGKATARPDGCQYEASHRGTDSIVDIGGLPAPHDLEMALSLSEAVRHQTDIVLRESKKAGRQH